MRATEEERSEEIFVSHQEVDRSTLLINPEFRSKSRILKFLDTITARIFSLTTSIFPVGRPIGLKLQFENLYTEEIVGRKVRFFVRYPDYPGDTTRLRLYHGKESGRKDALILEEGTEYNFPRKLFLNIPTLKGNDRCYGETKRWFFVPEVPGTHQLIIVNIPDVRYAAYYGLADREYAFIEGAWSASFHVSTIAEYRMLLLVFGTLFLSVVTLAITVANLFLGSSGSISIFTFFLGR